jgi:predicted component of type VI protein secretion system
MSAALATHSAPTAQPPVRGARAVVVPHETVSRQHAAIVHDEETTYIVDLGSAHGTFVDSQRIGVGVHTKVSDGAKLVLGSCPFAYSIQIGAPIPGRAPEPAAKRPRA